MSATPPPVQAALYYASRGLAVFPCAPDTKRPHAMLGPEGGLHHASTDAAIVAGWWGKDPAASIGLNLGASGLIAFDFEGPDKPPDKAGDPPAIAAAIRAAFGPDALPATWHAVSPSKGWHLLYRAPEGTVPTTLPVKMQGLDAVRSGGAYVVAPAVLAGEMVPDAQGRHWVSGPTPLEDTEPTPAPAWLEALARETARLKRAQAASPRARGRMPDAVDATPYGRKALMGLWGQVADTGEGGRHAALTNAAVRARSLEAGGHVTGEKWREVLAHAGAACGLPAGEVEGILEWAATESTVTPSGPERKGVAA